MEKPELKWEQEVEEEEQEEELLTRKARNGNLGTEIETNGHSDQNGEKVQLLDPVNGAEEALFVGQNEVPQELEISTNGGSEELEIGTNGGFDQSQQGVAEEIDIRNGGFEDIEKLLRAESPEVNGISENLVYFDDAKGTEPGNGVSLTEENSIEFEKEPVDAILEVNSPVDQTVTHDDLPVPSIQPTEVSVTVTESENEDELIDLHVKGVLAKQYTHNLHCPHCNSCITRVILRKRKRSKTSSEEQKPKRLGTPIVSPTPEDVIIPVDTNLAAVEVNDEGPDQGPDVFTCLSCFRIFSPSEGCFKLSWIFGDKSKPESSQDPPQLQSVKRNWFTAIFSPNKQKVVMVGEGSNQSTINNVGTRSPNMNVPLEDSSSLHVPLLTETSVAERKENENNIISTPTEATKLKPIVDVEQKINGATSNGTVLGKSDMNGKKVDDIPLQIPQYNQQQIVGAALLTETIAETDSQKVKEGYTDEKQELPLSSPVSGTGEDHVNETFSNSLYIPPRDDQKNGFVAHVLKPLTDDGTQFAKLPDGTYHSGFSHNTTVTTKVKIHSENPLTDNTLHQMISAQDASLLQGGQVDIVKIFDDISQNNQPGKDTIITVESERVETSASQTSRDISSSSQHDASPLVTLTSIAEERNPMTITVERVEIIKSIVYGGLVESITSLGVITSAAGSDASTVNVLALGMANLIGGLFVIGHDLWELKDSQRGGASNQKSEQVDRYKEVLGKRSNFTLHAIVAVISFFIFGLIPPTIYGFSFRQSNDRDLKLIAVAVASLLCIILLAVGKAYVRKQPKSYFKTMMYYVVIGTLASGASYVAGSLIMKLLHHLGLFEPTQGFSVSSQGLSSSVWATY